MSSLPSSSSIPSIRSPSSAYLSTEHLASAPPDSVTTLQSLLDHQAELEAEAREIMPFQFDECSYAQGALKQSVWACQDCGNKGVCYSCSLSCHADCRLVELFQRRNFTCDCPTSYGFSTSAQSHRCTLYPSSEPLHPNASNTYTKNFTGLFCRCGREYNPETEREVMICCLACEDWFHESCLNLQDPTPTPDPQPTATDISQSGSSAERASSTIPISVNAPDSSSTDEEVSPILPSERYEHLICGECVRKYPILQRYAGTRGWQMVVPAGAKGNGDWKSKWKVLGEDVVHGSIPASSSLEEHVESSTVSGSLKRKANVEATSSTEKKPRLDESLAVLTTSSKACTAPPLNEDAQLVLRTLRDGVAVSGTKGDLFLEDSAKEAMCRCAECSAQIARLPFPLEEEEIYEPPVDDDPEESLDDLTARALDGLPRSQAIETVLKFNEMKEKLKVFLEPFRNSDQVVRADDISDFMESIRGSA